MHDRRQEDRDVLAELCRLADAGGLTDEDQKALEELATVARRELEDRPEPMAEDGHGC